MTRKKKGSWGQATWGGSGFPFWGGVSFSAYDIAAMSISKTPTTLIRITIEAVAGTSQTAKVYLFSEKEKPLHMENPNTALPYLHKDITFGQEIQQSVTLIESISLVFFDDKETNSSFWLKWKAKNLFYVNSKIEILKGFTGFIESDYIIVFKGTIQNLKTRKDGKIELEAKSLLRITDNKVPQETDGELGLDPGTSSTANIVLKTGTDMSQYEDPVALGKDTYAKIQVENTAEIFQYTAISGTTFTGCTRGLFQADKFSAPSSYPSVGTDDIIIQQVRVFNDVNPIDVMQDLLEEAGLNKTPGSGGDLDNNVSQSFPTIKETWFSGSLVRAVIDFPIPAKTLLKELREITLTSLFQNSNQQIELANLTPPPIGATPKRITDNDSIIIRSSGIDDTFSKQLTRIVFYFNLRGGEDGTEDKHYSNKFTIKDSVRETNYGKEHEKKIKSRWLKSDLSGKTLAKSLAKRYIRIFGDGLQTIMFDLETKDDDLQVGDLFLLTTDQIEDSVGNTLIDVKFFVIKKEQVGSNKWRYIAYNARLTKQPAYIAASTAPVFTAATVVEKDSAFISNSSGTMSDGSDGYYII